MSEASVEVELKSYSNRRRRKPKKQSKAKGRRAIRLEGEQRMKPSTGMLNVRRNIEIVGTTGGEKGRKSIGGMARQGDYVLLDEMWG